MRAAPLAPAVTLGLAVALAGALPAAAEPRLEVALAPIEPTVGDRVNVELTLGLDAADAAPSAPPRFPAWGERWGEAEVLAAHEPEPLPGGGWRQRLVVAAFRTGEVALPAQSVAVPFSERTVEVATPAGLALRVRSVLPEGEEGNEPRPAAPPRALPWGERFLWSAAAATTLCLGAALLLWRRGRRAAAAAPIPDLAPLPELEAALAGLELSGAAERVHTALSLHLRRYLGRVLEFPATESTTTEVHRALQRRLPAELARRAVRLLRDCDRVKFARQEASAALAAERARAALEIAGAIDGHLRPAPAAAPPALEATA